MSRGKHLSLEEARSLGKLKEFAKQYHSEEIRPGRFDALLEAMTGRAKQTEDQSKEPKE